MKSLITIHDVVPETLDDILKIIVTMDSFGLPPAPILVSPGCEWTNGQIQTLQKVITLPIKCLFYFTIVDFHDKIMLTNNFGGQYEHQEISNR